MPVSPERNSSPPSHEFQDKKEPTVVYSKLFVVNSHTSPNDSWLSLARTAVGEGYVPYYHKYIRNARVKRAKGQDVAPETRAKYVGEVSQLMYDDPYGKSDRSETVCVFDRSETRGRQLAGTARVVFGEEYPTEVLRPLELIELVQPSEGEWDDVMKRKNLDKICEVGRIVIPKEYRGTNHRGENQSTTITQHLIDGENGVVQVAQEHGKEVVLMVAQKKFVKHTRGTSLDFGEGIPIELLPAARVVEKVFPGYWKDRDDKPKLYIAQVPPKPTK